MTCSGLEAPLHAPSQHLLTPRSRTETYRMTVETFGFLTHHASARQAWVQSRRFASSPSARTFAILALPTGPSSSLSVSPKKSLLVVKRESWGI